MYVCVCVCMKQLDKIQHNIGLCFKIWYLDDKYDRKSQYWKHFESFFNVLALLVLSAVKFWLSLEKNNSLNKTILNLWLFGIHCYCFSLRVIKGQCVPLSSSYYGVTEPLFYCLFCLLASCISFLILVFPTVLQKADLKSNYLLSWEKYLLSYSYHFVLQL